MYKWIAILLVFFSVAAKAQELNCEVKINYERITDANPQIFRTLERALADFINNTRWTNRNFARNEKIECSMFFNISAFDNNSSFTATLQVQSSRPIYNSTYLSPIFNYNDKDVTFNYTEGQVLFYNPNSYDGNLMAIIAFYANMIIGFDADSFQLNGGTEYYTAAQNMVILAQQSGTKGWNQGEGGNQNRFFMVNDILSNTFTPYREALYEYHLQSLDLMSEDAKKAKENAAKSLKTLIKVHSVRPNAFLTRLFFDAKSDEIVGLFSGGPSITLTEVIDNLNRLSPLNSGKWSNIK
ncbi:DUF4835 domain-containing protein [Flavobacterium cyanobacteriorum]|uniref:DUF4835 domain-containing protein n=1 Tax=Flavobacterium cyanobacteriorum TaxID=2022802 RepID=A0A255YVG0_9FLAO|nr:DUF4835 family protein [Flavobacterium cyanobacteriorum]OYQ33161.1 DUF4835 domain-containing protein [Flavobacterium cyanobacteriorum]